MLFLMRLDGEGNRDLDYRGKALTVRSQGGDPAACRIDCQADSLDQHRGFRFASGAAMHCWPGSQVWMSHSIVSYSTRGVGVYWN